MPIAYKEGATEKGQRKEKSWDLNCRYTYLVYTVITSLLLSCLLSINGFIKSIQLV